MGIDPKQLCDYVIIPTITEIKAYSLSAVNLVWGTCGQESQMGKYIRQLEGGPAGGIYQHEPKTFEDDIENFLVYQKDLSERIFKAINVSSYKDLVFERIEWDLKFATIMCRVHYLRFEEKLPKHDDIDGLARYWKKYYNTSLGKGRVTEFITNYELYIGDK